LLCGLVVCVVGITSMNNASRIERLRTHGISVEARITNCSGLIGGSGSNSAGYTCTASYRIGTETFHSVVGGLSTFQPTGTSTSVVADPNNHGAIELASVAKSDQFSITSVILPAVLALLFFGDVAWQILRRRRRKIPTTL